MGKSKIKIKPKLNKSQDWEILEDDDLSIAQDGKKISLDEFRPKFANSNENIQQEILKNDQIKNSELYQKQLVLKAINEAEEANRKKYEPSQAVKNTKAGLAAAQLISPRNLYLNAVNTGGDLYTSMRYGIDGQYDKAKEDLIQAGINWIPFLKGKPGMKQGTYNLSKLDNLINLGISGTQKGSDIKTIIEVKQSGGKIKTDPKGYWNKENHGKPVRIPSNKITMQGVNQPLIGISDTGDMQMMYPNQDYQFNGSSVVEIPIMQQGGRTPIYTSDRNRYQAYQDSLKLYNSYQDLKNNLKKAGYISIPTRKFGQLSEKDIIYSATVDPTKLSWLDKNTTLTGNTYYEDIDAKKEGNLYKTLDFYPGLINKDLGHQYFSTKIKPKSKESYRKYRFAGDVRLVYNYENVKPVQPVIYRPNVTTTVGDVTGDKIAKSKNNVAVLNSKLVLKERPKQESITLPSLQQELQTSNQQIDFNPIPFEQGSYFTRPRQNQEQGSDQFGRKPTTDYFDKKTGKILGSYQNGGNITTSWEIIED